MNAKAKCGAIVLAAAAMGGWVWAAEKPSEPVRRTAIGIVDSRWHINGSVTYEGAKAEGLLMNVRMVNATFEDRHRPDFDAEANTARFLEKLPDYHAHGVRALTLCLQGGHAGYEGALNSAFNPDGSLREEYLARVAKVIEACDRLGMAVILGCYYQRQDQVLRDEQAVRAGVVNAAKWIAARGFTNVMLEIANEFHHGGFNHGLIKSPQGQIELIQLARRTNPKLLVSTSGLGDGRMDEHVAGACDFILIHFNGTPVKDIADRIAAQRRHGKPVVCNEDDKQGDEAAKAARASVEAGGSWGLMLSELNQYQPFEFNGAADDPVVYGAMKALTTP